MARIKLKCPIQSPETKRRLLAILARNDVYAAKTTPARDGYIILTNNDETDILFGQQCQDNLKSENFTPVLPPEIKAKRTILLFGVDEDALNHSPEEISEEIYRVNEFTDDTIESIHKFPRSTTLKITFTQSAPAQKCIEQGVKLFYTRVPPHQVKGEEYVEVKTCMRCYEVDSHYASECKQDKNFKICSECASEGHFWQQCTSNIKKCINCQGDHRTLAYKCPIRKNARNRLLEEAKAKKNMTYSAAAAPASQPQNPVPNNNPISFPAISQETATKIHICMMHSHFVNISNPGSYASELNMMLKANNLPEVIIPTTPDSAKILNLPTLPAAENPTTPEPTSPPSPQQQPLTINQQPLIQEEEDDDDDEDDNNNNEDEGKEEEEETEGAAAISPPSHPNYKERPPTRTRGAARTEPKSPSQKPKSQPQQTHSAPSSPEGSQASTSSSTRTSPSSSISSPTQYEPAPNRSIPSLPSLNPRNLRTNPTKSNKKRNG